MSIDRVTSDLRNYEHQQDIAEQVGRRADELAAVLADDLMLDPDRLRELVADYELDIWRHLTRALMHLDRACEGDEIARAACLQALTMLCRTAKLQAIDVSTDMASELAWIEHRDERAP